MLDFEHLETYRENNRIEAKKATGGLPESIWETYSAFANGEGGILLLGVLEGEDKTLRAIDLPDPEGLVMDFWTLVNNPEVASANILSDRDVTIETVEGKRIVAIRVPKAAAQERPVYVHGSLAQGTYLRSGEGDFRCSRKQILEMLGTGGGIPLKLAASACLLGENCKYNGGNNASQAVAEFVKGREVLPLCPEMMAGLGCPRTPIEIVEGVLTDRDGNDVDAVLRAAVEQAMVLVRQAGVQCAVLQSRSPTCGVNQVYDGTFSGKRIPGSGVFAQALEEAGYLLIDAEDL